MRKSNTLVPLISMIGVAFLAAQLVGCKKKKKDDDDDSDPTVVTTAVSPGAASSGSSLAAAFPGSLALSVFSTEGGSSLRLADADAYDPAEASTADKIADNAELVTGAAASCLPKALAKKFNKDDDEPCYEFDQDMIYGTGDTGQAAPRWLGTKNGKSSGGEACLVAFTRNQVSQVVALVDQTLGFGMAGLCQYKKDHPESALPAVGASLDLTASLTSLFGAKATFASATLERLADVDSLPVYRILISTTDDAGARTIGIIHSPGDAENTIGSGTVYTRIAGDIGQAAGVTTSRHRLMSIVYNKSATNMVAELRTAQFAAAIADSGIVDGVVNFNAGADLSGAAGSAGYGDYTGYSAANDAIDGIAYVAFDLDTTTNEGTLSYWKNPGGNYYENARGFNIAISRDGAGTLGGCATSGSASTDMGSGLSIRRYLNEGGSLELSPKGFWHPFMNTPTSNPSDADGVYYKRTQGSGQVTKWYKPLLSDATLASTFATAQNGSLITRQCFKQDSDTGLYVIDTDEIADSAGYMVFDTGNAANDDMQIGPPPPPAFNEELGAALK